MIKTDLKPVKHKHSPKTYEVTLKLTAEDISGILDACLGEKIERADDNISEYLDLAERIKSYRLSDEYCQSFASKLAPLIQELISEKSDSYQMSNFQHHMLRRFSHLHPDKHKRSA